MELCGSGCRYLLHSQSCDRPSCAQVRLGNCRPAKCRGVPSDADPDARGKGRSPRRPTMSIMLNPFASCRIGFALIVTAMIGACGSTELNLPPCWQASDLKQGSTFRGTVLIFGSDDTRPSMFSLSCGGGVVADLPSGFTLPAPEGRTFNGPPERRFFQADVAGTVSGFAFGRPSVRLRRVEHVRREAPSWLRAKDR